MKNNESSKNSIRIILLIIVGVILIIGVVAFIFSNYVSKEFIYQETKECNNMKDDIKRTFDLEDDADCKKSTWDSIVKCGGKELIQEIFYSPKLNECVVITNKNRIKGITSSYNAEYKHNDKHYDCIIYKNGEKIKEYSNLSYDEDCSDKFKNLFQNEVNKLKRWY